MKINGEIRAIFIGELWQWYIITGDGTLKFYFGDGIGSEKRVITKIFNCAWNNDFCQRCIGKNHFPQCQ